MQGRSAGGSGGGSRGLLRGHDQANDRTGHAPPPLPADPRPRARPRSALSGGTGGGSRPLPRLRPRLGPARFAGWLQARLCGEQLSLGLQAARPHPRSGERRGARADPRRQGGARAALVAGRARARLPLKPRRRDAGVDGAGRRRRGAGAHRSEGGRGELPLVSGRARHRLPGRGRSGARPGRPSQGRRPARRTARPLAARRGEWGGGRFRSTRVADRRLSVAGRWPPADRRQSHPLVRLLHRRDLAGVDRRRGLRAHPNRQAAAPLRHPGRLPRRARLPRSLNRPPRTVGARPHDGIGGRRRAGDGVDFRPIWRSPRRAGRAARRSGRGSWTASPIGSGA